MIDSESYPIIVLGVERSGTSVVAEVLHRWGAYAGTSESRRYECHERSASFIGREKS